jgi:Short C-terminal domain
MNTHISAGENMEKRPLVEAGSKRGALVQLLDDRIRITGIGRRDTELLLADIRAVQFTPSSLKKFEVPIFGDNDEFQTLKTAVEARIIPAVQTASDSGGRPPPPSMPTISAYSRKRDGTIYVTPFSLVWDERGREMERPLAEVRDVEMKPPSRFGGTLRVIFQQANPPGARDVSISFSSDEYDAFLRVQKAVEDRVQQRAHDSATLTSLIASTEATQANLQEYAWYERTFLLDTYIRAYKLLEGQSGIGEWEIEALLTTIRVFGLTPDEVEFHDRLEPYIYANLIRRQEPLPRIQLKTQTDSSPILRPHEQFFFESPAALKELRTINKGVRGGSLGVALPIPVIGGAFRIGASQAQMVTENQWVTLSTGVLALSDQRVVLLPSGANRPVSIPLEYILSYHCFANGVTIHTENHDQPVVFNVERNSRVEMFGLCLGYLLFQRTNRQLETPAAAIASTAAPPSDVIEDQYDKLRKLGELRASGVLTEEEFQQEKAKVLGG